MYTYADTSVLCLSSIFGGVFGLRYAPKKNNYTIKILYASLGSMVFTIPIIFLQDNGHHFLSGIVTVMMAQIALE